MELKAYLFLTIECLFSGSVVFFDYVDFLAVVSLDDFIKEGNFVENLVGLTTVFHIVWQVYRDVKKRRKKKKEGTPDNKAD